MAGYSGNQVARKHRAPNGQAGQGRDAKAVGPMVAVLLASYVPQTTALAQSIPARQAAIFQALLWLMGILLVVCLSALLLWRLRSQAMRGGSNDEEFLNLECLRRLRQDGKLTDAEFQKLRDLTVHRL